MIDVLLVFLIAFLSVCVIGLFVESKKPPKQQPRRGLIPYMYIGTGQLNEGFPYSGKIEVVEKERSGDLVRVEVKDVYGQGDSYVHKQIRSEHRGWIVDSKVQWLDG